jgi:hypothetical protein
MQLDHRPGSGKRFGVGAPLWASGASERAALAAAVEEMGSVEAAFEAELAKCDVVCANCHAERTFQRRLAASVARRGARTGGACYGAGEVGGCRHAWPSRG